MTTLLLTNRFFEALKVIVFGVIICTPIVLLKSCEDQKDIPDVVYKARAVNQIIIDSGNKNGTYTTMIVQAHRVGVYDKWEYDTAFKANPFLKNDTTKPKQKVIYNHYKLEGSDTLFQMLWLQVQSPADVTPRSLQKLRDWLQSSIKIDSTIKQ